MSEWNYRENLIRSVKKRWQMGVIITEYCLPMRYRSQLQRWIMD